MLVHCSVGFSDEAAFLDELRGLLDRFNQFPGTRGAKVFRGKNEDSVEISVLQRFATKADHEAWLNSSEFMQWRTLVEPYAATTGHVRRYTGMESLFVSAAAPDAPPRWKMALLLLLAVYPLSILMSAWLAPILATVPILLGALLTSLVMVWLMTYVLVPALTRCFQQWLTPVDSKRS